MQHKLLHNGVGRIRENIQPQDTDLVLPELEGRRGRRGRLKKTVANTAFEVVHYYIRI